MLKAAYKISRSQFEVLYKLYETYTVGVSYTTPAAKLLHTIQLQVWIKLRKLDVEYKQKYKLSLTPAEEQAFMLFWGQFNFSPSSPEGNITQSIINLIHPKYV
jgi:hypothetical protein